MLLYHAVGGGDWATEERDFVKQMEWVAGKTRPLSIVQALGTDVEAPLEVAVTFDDGYESVFSGAYPILRSLGITASVFLNTAHIADRERVSSRPEEGHYPGEAFLLWREVDALLESGWVMGSHGAHHLDLTRQPDDVVARELSESKSSLERMTPGPCRYFAYTWGRHTPRLRKLAADAGYRWALACTHGRVLPSSDPFAIPRINVDRNYSLRDFEALLRGDWDYLRFIQSWRSAHS